MFRLAVANLTQNRTRLFLATSGAGVALALVLVFQAVFTGASARLTAYIDRTGADVWVSQEGVRTLHMSTSVLPSSVVEAVRSVPGVADAVPVRYATDSVAVGQAEFITYVFAVPERASVGGPWRIVAGTGALQPGEIVIDRSIAGTAGARLGDRVRILGRDFQVVGLIDGTSSLVSSVSFVRVEDFVRARGSGDAISYVLVRAQAGTPAQALAEAIRLHVTGVTVQTRSEFAAEERQLVADMSTDIITIMNTAGYLTGLAVVMLNVYIATVARRREYGVLKALGMRNGRLYQIIVIQALITTGLGLAGALLLTLSLALLLPWMDGLLVLSLDRGATVRVALTAAVLAVVASLAPARLIARVDPASVVRRGTS